jgi:2-dehydropantoate 2-reductase
MRGTVGEIEAAPGGTDLARQLLSECAAIAAASGYPPGEGVITRIKATVTAPGSPLASSMYRDLQHGRNVEVDHILGDLLERARRLGVSAPLLTAAFAHLRLYQQRAAAQ